MPDEQNPYFPEHGSSSKAAYGIEQVSSPATGIADVRNVVNDLLLAYFPRSGTILKLGNTGDFHAHFLSAYGFHVVMAELNQINLRLHRGHINGIDRILSAEEHLDCIKDSCIDGILASKGWLNSFRNIEPALYYAFRVLKDNGVCVLVLRNHFSIAESLAYIQHGQFQRAFQRARRNGAFIPSDEYQLLVWYHSLHSVKRAARGLFTIQKVVGLNIITPPPSFLHLYREHPRLMRAAARVET